MEATTIRTSMNKIEEERDTAMTTKERTGTTTQEHEWEIQPLRQPWSDMSILTSVINEQAAENQGTPQTIEDESSRMAMGVLITKIFEAREHAVELRREQLEHAAKGAEARLQKYYLEAGLLHLLPKSATIRGTSHILLLGAFNEKLNKARFNYDRLQRELRETETVLVELEEVKLALEEGAALPV